MIDKSVFNKSMFDDSMVDNSTAVERTVDDSMVDNRAVVERTVDNSMVDNGAVVERTVDNSMVGNSAVVERAVDNSMVDNSMVDNSAVDNSAVDDSAADDSIFIIGYGNPGRQDDGLGPAFIRRVEEWNYAGVTTQMNYQLTVEDACDIARFDIVVFVDAALRGEPPFYFRRIETGGDCGFGSHNLSPRAVIELCETVFGAKPQAYALGIRGHQFGHFEEKLSREAEINLEQACRFFQDWIHAPNGDPPEDTARA